MKKLIIIVIFLSGIYILQGQSLIDIYQKGNVKLIADTEYGKGNDWNKIFETYNDTLYGKPMGNRKSIVMMPDGSIVVNHAYRNYYSLFGPDGKFIKEFGITNKSGKRFKKTQSIQGVINNNFFTGLDNTGKMIGMDFEGNYVKTLTLDYMTKDMIPLKDNKFAVVGWAIWKDKFRDFVSIVDYDTNEEKIIWEHFTNRCEEDSHCQLFNYFYSFENGGGIGFSTMPFSKYTGMNSPPQISFVNDRLIIALPSTGEILAYDIDGQLQLKDKITWAASYISVEEQKEIQQKAIENYKAAQLSEKTKLSETEFTKMKQEILSQMQEDLDKIKDPIPKPVFSTIIKDSDGNLLFFEVPEEEGGNKFNVWIYKDGGKFVCRSSFTADGFNFSITPSKMIFHNGYIYALQTVKDTEGIPLRLVRFKAAN